MVQSSPSTKTLREFAALMAGVIAGLFGLLLPLLKGHSLPPIPWAIAAVFAGLGMVAPRSLKPIYQSWLKLGEILAWINDRLILTLVFSLIITPMALIMKLLKRDTMARQWQPQTLTYRNPCRPRPIQHLEKPY